MYDSRSEPSLPRRSLPGIGRWLCIIISLSLLCCCQFFAGEAPVKLRLLGSWPGHGRGQVGSLALTGDRAYYTASDGGVVMLDISNPENIRPLGGLQTQDIAHSIALAGGNAYVTIHRGLQIF